MYRDVASGADRHLDITFGLQVLEGSFLVSVLFSEAFSHPYISLFHSLVNGFSVIYLHLFTSCKISGINSISWTCGWSLSLPSSPLALALGLGNEIERYLSPLQNRNEEGVGLQPPHICFLFSGKYLHHKI